MTKQQICFPLGKVLLVNQKEDDSPPINLVQATIQLDAWLAVTLCFLATGETFCSFKYFRISGQMISAIVSDRSCALYRVLAPEFLKMSGK